MIVLENSRLSVTIDETNGKICGLRDKAAARDYLLGQLPADSFRIELGSGVTGQFSRCSYAIEESDAGASGKCCPD